MTRWYEDIVIDEVFDLGAHSFEAADMIDFATLYDPQPVHTDPHAAAASFAGGLVASSWHIASVGHRKMVDTLFAEEERLRALGQEPGVSGPSPGVNSMDFPTLVRPGDVIRFQLVVTGKRPSNSLPGWGLLFNRLSGINQRGELVYSAELVGFSKLRDYRAPWWQQLLQALTRVPLIGPLVARLG